MDEDPLRATLVEINQRITDALARGRGPTRELVVPHVVRREEHAAKRGERLLAVLGKVRPQRTEDVVWPREAQAALNEQGIRNAVNWGSALDHAAQHGHRELHLEVV